MSRRRNWAVATATICASFALASSVGAATPKAGTYSWTDDGEAVDVVVNDNRKTFDFVRVVVFCGPENDPYFITYDDPKGKDGKIRKNGRFEVTNKLADANDASMTKKFTLEGKFVKPRSGPFKLHVNGCGPNRLGELRPPNMTGR